MEVGDQLRPDAEERVPFDRRVVTVEDMGSQRLVSLGRDTEMQMRGPFEPPPESVHQSADRPVLRQEVALRSHGAETEPAVRAGAEPAAQVVLRLAVRNLVLVEPLAVGLPDLDQRPGDAPAVEVANDARPPAAPRRARRATGRPRRVSSGASSR